MNAAKEARAAALRSTLRDFPAPIVAMSDRLEVIEGSTQAGILFGVEPGALAGRLPGDVIRCVNAQAAKCGTTPECPSCELRGTLTRTMRDGTGAAHALASRQVLVANEPRDVLIEFSTERVGQVGLFVVHRVGMQEPIT